MSYKLKKNMGKKNIGKNIRCLKKAIILYLTESINLVKC